MVFKLDSGREHALFIGDVFHHLLQVYYPHWNFPKNSDAEEARASRRKVLELCAATGALTLPGHVGAPFAGRVEAARAGFVPTVLSLDVARSHRLSGFSGINRELSVAL